MNARPLSLAALTVLEVSPVDNKVRGTGAASCCGFTDGFDQRQGAGGICRAYQRRNFASNHPNKMLQLQAQGFEIAEDRKSTRLNSSHNSLVELERSADDLSGRCRPHLGADRSHS